MKQKYGSLWALCALSLLTLQAVPTQPEEPSTHDISALSGSTITVVLDLGGVLFDTNKMAAFKALGMTDILSYVLQTRNSPRKIKNALYRMLDTIQPHKQDESETVCPQDPDGDRLPSLMCDWMTGRKSCAEIKEIINYALKNARKKIHFSCRTERRLAIRLARMMFTPEKFAATRAIQQDGVKFAAYCKKRGCRIAILSNWDPESFKIIRKKYHELFDLCEPEHIFISGNMGVMKPDPATYQAVRDAIPDDTLIFVDDQLENITASAKLFHPILCRKKGMVQKGPDFDAVRAQFKKIVACHGVVTAVEA